MPDICGDNRFEIIAEYKKRLIDGTNIESRPDEMAIIDSILFRFWQMGWLEPKQRWIPVTEEFPKAEYGESEAVLTIDTMGVMRVAYWDGGNWSYPNGNPIPTIIGFPITHWMPLPEPPKEDDDAKVC